VYAVLVEAHEDAAEQRRLQAALERGEASAIGR